MTALEALEGLETSFPRRHITALERSDKFPWKPSLEHFVEMRSQIVFHTGTTHEVLSDFVTALRDRVIVYENSGASADWLIEQSATDVIENHSSSKLCVTWADLNLCRLRPNKVQTFTTTIDGTLRARALRTDEIISDPEVYILAGLRMYLRWLAISPELTDAWEVRLLPYLPPQPLRV